MTVLEQYENRPHRWITNLIMSLIVIFLICWSAGGIEYNGVAAKGSSVATGIIYGIVHPDMQRIFNLTTDGVPYLMLQTVAIAFLGTLFGAVLAIPVSFLSSSRIVPKPVATVFRILVLLIRTIPSLVWALVWIRVTGPGPVCGVVTQSICSIGMISKMYVTAIDDLDTKILESLDAAGCNTFEKIRCGVLPQLTANFLSTAIYRFDINLKDASTLGIVGAGGIGSALNNAINSNRWSLVGSFISVLIIVCLIIEYFSTKIRAKLARG